MMQKGKRVTYPEPKVIPILMTCTKKHGPYHVPWAWALCMLAKHLKGLTYIRWRGVWKYMTGLITFFRFDIVGEIACLVVKVLTSMACLGIKIGSVLFGTTADCSVEKGMSNPNLVTTWHNKYHLIFFVPFYLSYFFNTRDLTCFMDCFLFMFLVIFWWWRRWWWWWEWGGCVKKMSNIGCLIRRKWEIRVWQGYQHQKKETGKGKYFFET